MSATTLLIAQFLLFTRSDWSSTGTYNAFVDRV